METNEVISTENLCRTCMLESTNMISLFYSVNHQDRTLGEMLSFVTNMSVKLEDELPKHMCSHCESLTTQSNSFKLKCLETETKFQTLLKLDKKSSNLSEEYLVKTENTDWDLQMMHPYQCTLCNLKFAKINDLESHVLEKKNHLVLKALQSKNEVKGSDESQIELKVPHKASVESVKEEVQDNSCYSEDDFMFSTTYFHNNIFEADEDLEKLIHIKEKKQFQCSFCNLVFDEKSDYEKHVDNDSCSAECINKDPKTKKRKNKVKNMTQLEKNKKFVCEMCSCNFTTLDLYKKHKKQVHDNITLEEMKKYECSHCMRKFVKKSTLASHLKRHANPTMSHICSICKREFIHKAHLENHILSIHTTQDGFKCDYCPKSFATKESLEFHKDGHRNLKRHRCKFCSKAFNMLSTLRDHLRVHTGEKPFLCPTCGKGFTQNTNLQEHLRRHQGVKPFKCEMCERRFVSKGELSAHTRKHSGAHPFVCTDCGGAFTTSSSLVKHRRTHTGERPYQCDLCDMKFAASGTLKNHRRTHTGEKPYKCSHCEKAFVQKNDLVAHTRCHTGERPYVCSTCGQAFRQGSALKTHLKMHSAKEVLPIRKDLLQTLMPSLNHSV